MKRIKIAEVITRLDWGGSPDILRILCQNLATQDYELTLISGLTRFPSLRTKDFLNKFKGNVIFINQLIRNINPIYDLIAFLRLLFLFRRQRFDIVHTHTAKAGVLGRLAAYLAGVPVIIHMPPGHNFYGYFSGVFIWGIVMIERLLSRITDKIITLTELEKMDFIRFKVASKDKIAVIYQGLELEKYADSSVDSVDKDTLKKEFNIAKDEKVVGFVGRLEPIKGIGYLIEAAHFVLEKLPQTKFIITGEGSLHRDLERKIIQGNLRDKILLTGWREDIREILSILDVLVLPSLNEAVGMILIEAQAQGLAPVATRVGGIPEVVQDGKTGILVRPKDAQALAEAIEMLLEDKERRIQMGRQARQWIKERFNVENMVRSISDLYQNLVMVK
ncbi:MAG: glycosyltransferase family 4 protein [Candidatus Omnitrophica bacterium]|nr:glycosyltransferase family 4 protein [Candidatus Omnitrophota bacterium]